MSSPPRLPPQDRQRALAELEPLIARVEVTVARLRRDAEAGDRGARMKLVPAEERLARLQASRRVLVEGESGAEEVGYDPIPGDHDPRSS